MELFNYSGKVAKVVDGDTVDVVLDLGFEVYKKVRCRLNGIDSPETNTEAGKIAKTFLTTELPVDTPVKVASRLYDKYGRSVADIYKGDVNINQFMIDSGHAVVYKA
jgi:micrococcal nuclease